MKSIIIREKDSKGKNGILIKIVDNKDGSYDLTVKDAINKQVTIQIRSDEGERVHILQQN